MIFTAEAGDVLSFAGNLATTGSTFYTVNELTDSVVLNGSISGDLINKLATGVSGFDNSGFSSVSLVAGEVYTYTRSTVVDVETNGSSNFGGTANSGSPHTLTLNQGIWTNAIGVPEPSSSMLLSFGAVMLLSFRKRI